MKKEKTDIMTDIVSEILLKLNLLDKSDDLLNVLAAIQIEIIRAVCRKEKLEFAQILIEEQAEHIVKSLIKLGWK